MAKDKKTAIEQPEYELKINGKVTKFRKKVPLRDGHVLREFLRRVESDDYYDDVPALKLLVEPCELVADPASDACWDDLDTFSELVPLIAAASRLIVAKTLAAREIRKN